MGKKIITMTNGASAEDISNAIGQFLDSIGEEQEDDEEGEEE